MIESTDGVTKCRKVNSTGRLRKARTDAFVRPTMMDLVPTEGFASAYGVKRAYVFEGHGVRRQIFRYGAQICLICDMGIRASDFIRGGEPAHSVETKIMRTKKAFWDTKRSLMHSSI